MIATVFTPNGIVVATTSLDTFNDYTQTDNGTLCSPINVEGLPHTYCFWDRYLLMFNGLNPYSPQLDILNQFDELCGQWDGAPSITDFIAAIGKLIKNNHIQIIGIIAAYAHGNDGGEVEPFVYQILGNSINRVNQDGKGNPIYSCVCLEKKPHISKLMRQSKIMNGDQWEEYEGVRLRCDLFSVSKAIDLCRFLLWTNHYIENVNSASYDSPLKADLSIITREQINISLMEI